MAMRLDSAGGVGTRKQSPIAPGGPTAAAQVPRARSSDDEAHGLAPARRSVDICGKNRSPVERSRTDWDHAEYASEWDPRLS